LLLPSRTRQYRLKFASKVARPTGAGLFAVGRWEKFGHVHRELIRPSPSDPVEHLAVASSRGGVCNGLNRPFEIRFWSIGRYLLKAIWAPDGANLLDINGPPLTFTSLASSNCPTVPHDREG